MNQRINSTNLKQALQSRTLIRCHEDQQGDEGYRCGQGRRGHNISNNRDEDDNKNSSRGRSNTPRSKDKSHK